MSRPDPSTQAGRGPYVPRMRATWWLSNRRYFLFMVRELTSVFIGAFVILYLLQLRALGRGAEAYEAFLACLRLPGSVAFHALVLAFALFHSLTWFHLTSRIQVVRLGHRVVDRRAVTALTVLVWLGVSGGVLLFWARG